MAKRAEMTRSESPQREPSAEPARQPLAASAVPAFLTGLGNQATLRYLRRKCACGGSCSVCKGSAERAEDRHAHEATPPDTTLKINEPGDRFEREADAVAEQVMRSTARGSYKPLAAGPSRSLQRKCARCEEEERRQKVQRTDTGTGPGLAPPIVHEVLRSPGRPLDSGLRGLMEPRLGHDFRSVRIHTDSRAAASARAVDAQAYTLGRDIVFAEGRYAPGSIEGQRLLAHELSHIVQQSRPGAEIAIRRQPAPGLRGRTSTPSHGRVLFVQVDRTANTISFVTESGTLTYKLLTPTEVPAGSYKFSVSVQGNNLTLSAPAEATHFSGFQYRIAAGQANPADLLRGQNQVSVMVLEGGNITPSSTTTNVTTGTSGDAGPVLSIPVTFVATPIAAPTGGSSRLPTITPFTTGTGIGLHNLAFNDLSWLNSPLSRPYWESLLPRPGIPLERSLVGLDTPVTALPSRLTPRLQTYLSGRPPGAPLRWINEYGAPLEFQPDPASPLTREFTAQELLSIDGLVRRYNANPGSLSPAELQLLREAARIHIGAPTPTAPVTSYSVPGRPVAWTGDRQFVVRVNVDRSAALNVSEPNAFNLGQDAITNVEEAEFLVVGDQSGRIISVQTVKSLESGGRSWIFENAGAIRWGGRIVLVAGLAYSGYRIASATPEERPRVIGEEAGGLGGGLAGGALATAGCIAFGIVTEGVGLLLCGLVGGVAGGAAGSYAGGAFASGGWIQRFVEEGARRDYEHFKQLNPDATPADYDRLQQVQEDFDAWGLPGANW